MEGVPLIYGSLQIKQSSRCFDISLTSGSTDRVFFTISACSGLAKVTVLVLQG